jgi:carboxylate-amine ligase
VHVGLHDREAAIHVLNRARIWLAPLLALAANSPFWLGSDTGYASYRTQLWGRFPMAGQPALFASRAEYDALVRALVATDSIEDATKIYWDIRLPEHIDTVEMRVTDVCLTVDEAVMVAGLARALVRTCYERAQRDEPFPAARPELLHPAHWRAARYGLGADLIDVGAERAVPARELIDSLLAFVRPALEAAHDWDEVSALVHATLVRGNGAERQRAAYERAGRWEDVVDFIIAETAKGTGVGA